MATREFPVVIDPHVHFRVPGEEYKEDWLTASQAAQSGGVGMVFDMPNNQPSIDSVEKLEEKNKIIQEQLAKANCPLKYKLYFGATANNIEEIKKLKGHPLVCGVKLYMGSSTGELLVDKDEDIKKIFAAAKEADLIVSVHAEDEEIIKANLEQYKEVNNFSVHSKIRNSEAAAKAVQRAIDLTREVGNRLYICHLSTKAELDLVKQAKSEGLSVYAEVCTHHLFLNADDYDILKGKVKVNPPLRNTEDIEALWQGLNDGTVDTLGTDHAPHTLEEKNQSVLETPSGIPGIETLLPLMLNAVNEGRISLDKLADLMHNNVIKIFNLEELKDKIVIDLDLEREVRDQDLKTKCGWSPYSGRILKGWPVKIDAN